MVFKSLQENETENISFRDLGILVFAFTTGKSINGREYAKIAREGRDSVYRSLQFLSKNGYTTTSTEKINGKLIRSTRLTSKSISLLMNLGIRELSANPDSQYCLMIRE